MVIKKSICSNYTICTDVFFCVDFAADHFHLPQWDSSKCQRPLCTMTFIKVSVFFPQDHSQCHIFAFQVTTFRHSSLRHLTFTQRASIVTRMRFSFGEIFLWSPLCMRSGSTSVCGGLSPTRIHSGQHISFRDVPQLFVHQHFQKFT